MMGSLGGRRRRALVVLLVLALATVAGLGGFLVGRGMKSPADAVADRRPPQRSPVSVLVEYRTLKSQFVIRGLVAYPEASPITLAGAVGGDAVRQLVTVTSRVESVVVDGSVVAEVSGRPVIVVGGAQPMYRTLRVGSTGTDVEQLQAALERFGFDPGPIDGTYRVATARAVADWYESLGFVADGRTAQSTRSVSVPAGEVTFVPELPARVVEVLIPVGGTVEGPLLQLAAGNLEVEATIEGSQRDLVYEGMPVELNIDGVDAAGRISVIDERGDQGTAIRIEITGDPDPAWRSSSARVVVPVAATGLVLAVPLAAVSTNASGDVGVSLLDPETGLVREVKVETGLVAEGFVEITNSFGYELSIGDRVIVGEP